MQETLMVVGFCVALLLGFLISLQKWHEAKYNQKGLPPGTMGWPFFGETKDFVQKGPSFMKAQRHKYGNVFKTHFLGSPAVISMDPDLNRFVLTNEAKGLVPGYPKSMLDILGRNISSVIAGEHKHIRKNFLSLVGIPAIKEKLFRNTVNHTTEYISGWNGLTVDFQDKAMELAFFELFKQLVEVDTSSIYDKFKSEFDKLQIGTLSLPINLPGTNYRTGLKAKRNVVRFLRNLLETRRASKETYNDILESLVRPTEDYKHPLNDDEEIIEQIVTILYSGYETVSKTMMMCVKYLHDNPKSLEQLREEQFAIKQKKGGKPLEWEDYRAMRFTRAVILEASRLASIVNGVLRKTTQDVELDGFFIPKGWRIYVYTRELNYDAVLYSEPFKFNPWRWMQKDNLEANAYCLLFGGGSRECPGKEIGIVKVSVFLHLFATTYKWEEVGEQKLDVFPRVIAPNGYHIKVDNL